MMIGKVTMHNNGGKSQCPTIFLRNVPLEEAAFLREGAC